MNNYRIELTTLPMWRDARGEGVIAQAENVCGIKLDKVLTRDVFTLVSDCTAAEAQKIAALLCNPVLQMWRTAGAASDNFTMLPGCDGVETGIYDATLSSGNGVFPRCFLFVFKFYFTRI